ncbi:MAG: hypothetical protein IKW20_03160 [Bacteroidales bacterium]|nr:hypothetical protein [Bacteroidales bacterium]
MKKLIYIVGVLLFAFVACQKDEAKDSHGEDCVARLTVQVPEDVLTKAVAQAALVDIVYYDVWTEDFETLLFSGSGAVEDCRAELEVALVMDQTFQFIFWAQNENADGPYSWTDLKKVNVDYSKFTVNNKDCYDAFYAVATIVADGEDKVVRLYRPFAQLNFGATRMNADFGDFTITSNSVTVSKYASAFDTVGGKAVDYVNAPATFTAATGGLVQAETLDSKDLQVGDGTYYWVAMNYLLVPSDQSTTVNVEASFTTKVGTVKHKIPNVPLNKNYRTNIVGDLFTSTAQLNIVVEESFKTPDENKYL